ncbi:MAG: transglutaminaseTgpA domain-containing protein [Bacillus sp. (in: firmicutes)]
MKRDIPSFLLNLLGFILLWEWLRPVEKLTNTENIEIFIIFLLLSFLLSYLNLKWIWQFLIKIFYIFFSINQLHYEEGFVQASWVKSFFANIAYNMGLLMNRQWNEITNEFRSLLFFVLLWLMVYLIQYWMLNRQRIFIFFFMTLVYITVLDTFTPYSAKAAIVRTVVAGFALMGMLTFSRVIRTENVTYDPSFIRKWMRPLVIMIMVSVLVGIAAPKAAPIWPDPVPYLTANNDKDKKESAGGIHRIGYGTDDSALGGPFIGDNNPVFQYQGNGKTYWKMETKDMYTGKGWLASGSTPIEFRQEDLVPVFSYPSTVETIKESVSVRAHVNYSYNYIMYPAGIKKVVKIQPVDQDGNKFFVDTTNERISFFKNDNRPAVPQVFTLSYEKPKYKAADLLETTSFNPNDMNPEFYKKYTQVPETLPGRVKELAEDITKDKSNWFEKAKAVESYFGNTDFTYDQKNVAVPGAKDDYVDQFLFETKKGYCDNYSSSMAIMLRSIGIPTRWVKGFTGGDFLQYSDEDSGEQVYAVSNNNAHSWVEVYFPNQGWVPFEPTKGFSNDIIINYEAVGNSANNPSATPVLAQKPQKEEIEEPNPTKDTESSFDFSKIWDTIASAFKNNWKTGLFLLVILAFVVWILYRIRGRWVPYFVMLRFKFKKNDENIGVAYLVLLGQLERYGLKRKENQTLRHYARYIDSFFSTREMTRLTVYYEQYMYHQKLPKGAWEESYKLWENLIKKTIA